MNKLCTPESRRFNVPDLFLQRSWMVVYTRSRYEKKVDQLLSLKKISSFCPLIKTRKKWADRYKVVDLPLFTSYVFVHVNKYEKEEVLRTEGVVNFVSFNRMPAVVPDADIDRIRLLLNSYDHFESINAVSLSAGDPIVINNGILFDCRGEILEIQGKSVLVVLKQLDCALVAKVKVNLDQLILSKSLNSNYLVAG